MNETKMNETKMRKNEMLGEELGDVVLTTPRKYTILRSRIPCGGKLGLPLTIRSQLVRADFVA